MTNQDNKKNYENIIDCVTNLSDNILSSLFKDDVSNVDDAKHRLTWAIVQADSFKDAIAAIDASNLGRSPIVNNCIIEAAREKRKLFIQWMLNDVDFVSINDNTVTDFSVSSQGVHFPLSWEDGLDGYILMTMDMIENGCFDENNVFKTMDNNGDTLEIHAFHLEPKQVPSAIAKQGLPAFLDWIKGGAVKLDDFAPLLRWETDGASVAFNWVDDEVIYSATFAGDDIKNGEIPSINDPDSAVHHAFMVREIDSEFLTEIRVFSLDPVMPPPFFARTQKEQSSEELSNAPSP